MIHLYKKLKINLAACKFIVIPFLVLIFSAGSLTAQNYTLTSNGDTHAVDQTTSPNDASSQITLRSALEAATNIAGTHIITIPGSITTINLTLGQITIGNASIGNNITVNGPGKAVLTISQTTLNRVFITGSGAITFALNDLTLNYNGPAGSFGGGGGAILSGGINANTSLTNVAINNFNIQFGNGGAISCSTSNTNNFSLTNCDFNNNYCGGGGGAVSYVGNSNCTISKCNFIGNQTGPLAANTGGDGGAISTSGSGNGGTYSITNCTFVNNKVNNTTGHAGAIMNSNGALSANYNRFIGNSTTNTANPPLANVIGQAGGTTVNTINADNNWWGVNTGPAANDAMALAAGGTITLTKWLQLKASASPSTICAGGATSTVTASFLSNSASEAIPASNLVPEIGLPISFVNPTLGTLSAAQSTIQSSGTATVTFTSGASGGAGSVNAVVDNVPNNDATAKANITINSLPATTNPGNQNVAAGSSASFTVTPSGTGATVQWQEDQGSGFNNLSNGAPYSGVTTNTLTINPTTAGMNGYKYRAVVSGTCTPPAISNAGTLTVTGGPVLPNLSINDVSLNEGNAGTTSFTFTVSLSSAAPAGGVIFDIATADGTAIQPSDYTQKSLTGQSIPAGSLSYTFTVLVNGDLTSEPNETFFVNVTNVTNANVTDGQGQGTIVNDDAAGIPNLSINDVSLNEGNAGTTSFTFTVSLSSAAPAGGVTFDITTADGTAIQPSDYTQKSLTGQTIPAGSLSYSFTVLVNGDLTPEPNETFFVNVTNVTNANVTDGQGQGIIVNEDAVAPANNWYVNDTNTSGDQFTTGVGNDATGTGSSSQPFRTIGKAVSVASSGDIIWVDAGNYSEYVNITKSLKIYGSNYNISPITGSRHTEAVITAVASSAAGSPTIFEASTPGTNIEIKGLKLVSGSPLRDGHIHRHPTQDIIILFEKNLVNNGNNLFAGTLTQWKTVSIIDNYFTNITLTSTASAIQLNDAFEVPFGTHAATVNATITDNKIETTSFGGILLDNIASATVLRNIVKTTPGDAGIQLAGGMGNSTVMENDIRGANTGVAPAGPVSDGGGIRIYGSEFTGTVNITNNLVAGNSYNGFAVANGQVITNPNIHVNNNNFAVGNLAAGSFSIYHGGTDVGGTGGATTPAAGKLDAECNWYGSTNTATVAADVSGPVDFSPFLNSGTDGSTNTGFQPTGSCSIAVPIALLNPSFDIYPVPVADRMNIKFTSVNQTQVSITVVDEVGRTLQKENTIVTKGINLISFSVRNLHAGNYIVILNDGKTQWHQKVIKL